MCKPDDLRRLPPSQSDVHNNLGVGDAVRVAERFGCVVLQPRRTGEFVFSHPLMTKKVRINSRRKDSPRQLVVWLRTLEAMRITAPAG